MAKKKKSKAKAKRKIKGKPKNADLGPSRAMGISMYEKEILLIKAAAREENKTVSEWCRERLLRAIGARNRKRKRGRPKHEVVSR